MHKRHLLGIFVLIASISLFFVGSAHALGSSTLVISQAQLGTAISASNEFIELYNNASTDTELTNWCVYYASATSMTNGSKVACFTADNDLIHLYLPAHSYAFAISSQLLTTFPTLGSDIRFSATLSSTAGHIRLIDSNGQVIDKLAWGLGALSPESVTAASVPPNGKVLQRKSVVGVYQDTDTNGSDFELAAPRSSYVYGAIYEVLDLCSNIAGIQTVLPDNYSVDTAAQCLPPPVDVCDTIDGLQVKVPDGYGLDISGTCQVDICSNITGLQLTVPIGKDIDSVGVCIDHDECSNIDGIQSVVPAFYSKSGAICLLQLPHIEITEVLPNAIGVDAGHEFIELHNPQNYDINLALYRLQVGIDIPKRYSFPSGSVLPADGYMSFSNDDIAFTLVNTAGQVRLIAADGQPVDDSPVYEQPYDGLSWALVDATWQYTDRPTPGGLNQASLPVEMMEDTVTGQKPCASNQSRHPDTNRCRSLLVSGSTLAACKDGQYRSEETNRCRSIGTDVSALVLCAEDQERNPSTNRCRTIATAAAPLVACKEGQERSIDTNRCRNVTKITDPGYSVQPVTKNSDNASGLIALAVIITIAGAYAIWEWRIELMRLLLRARSFLTSVK